MSPWPGPGAAVGCAAAYLVWVAKLRRTRIGWATPCELAWCLFQAPAGKSAELVKDMLAKLRSAYELAPYEYTKVIRIAPGEIPHSHPILTLNTMIRAEGPLLCTYLHEQMHWYVTWYSYANNSGWRAIFREIREMFPSVPVAFPQGAHTEGSSYLHIIVNWLEVESAASLLGRASAEEIASKNFVYSGIYALVLEK